MGRTFFCALAVKIVFLFLMNISERIINKNTFLWHKICMRKDLTGSVNKFHLFSPNL
ncbi:hypothetical protein DNO_0896 [Dichelobacter nodosus VCS1703A]|uniref:Uncharacterized protein n=1 Tax=Dichelobacter nodosus (strain VCS1703A) TaxID=246195 RepID=A5EY92_DICNV|nr:hypothetical protein DNO_0896 [Dichelobacter nodosus VCS1703A]